jgi:hypothetical protein
MVRSKKVLSHVLNDGVRIDFWVTRSSKVPHRLYHVFASSSKYVEPIHVPLFSRAAAMDILRAVRLDQQVAR